MSVWDSGFPTALFSLVSRAVKLGYCLRVLPLLRKTIAKLRAKTPTSPQGGNWVLLMLGTGSLETSLLGCIVDFRESRISQLLPKPVPNRVTSYKSEKSTSGRQTRAGLSLSPCVGCDFVSDIAEGRTLACAAAVVCRFDAYFPSKA